MTNDPETQVHVADRMPPLELLISLSFSYFPTLHPPADLPD